MESPDRRLFVRTAASVATVGLAGCSSLVPTQSNDGGGSETSASGAAPVPGDASFAFEYTDGAVEISLQDGGPIPASNLAIQSSTGAQVDWPTLGSTSVATDGSVSNGDTATVGPSVLNWQDEVQLTETLYVIFTTDDGAPTTIDRFDLGEEVTTTAAPVPDVLQKPLQDPEEHIEGRRVSLTRAIGDVRIDTEAGQFYLEGPGNGAVTAIAGYISASDLQPTGSWGRMVDDKTKRFGTNATNLGDELRFDPESFDGVALRAVKGINLWIDGEIVAERVESVRYSRQRGVMESSPV